VQFKNYVMNFQSPILSHQCIKIGCNKMENWRLPHAKEILENAVQEMLENKCFM
jgi:hypothetical protein